MKVTAKVHGEMMAARKAKRDNARAKALDHVLEQVLESEWVLTIKSNGSAFERMMNAATIKDSANAFEYMLKLIESGAWVITNARSGAAIPADDIRTHCSK